MLIFSTIPPRFLRSIPPRFPWGVTQRILSRNGRFLYEYSTGLPLVCQIGRANEDADPWVAGHAINKSMTIDCESSSAVPATSA